MAKFAAVIQQCGAGEADGFADGLHWDSAAPAGVADEIPGAAFGNIVEDLPNHDASAFEGRLAVTNLGIGHDVSAQLNPFSRALCRASLAFFMMARVRLRWLYRKIANRDWLAWHLLCPKTPCR